MPYGPWKPPADDGEAMVFALKHPLRRRLLSAYAEGEYSPTQVSRRLDEELRRAAYHTRALAFYGVVELVGTQPSRGSTQHFYRASDLGRRALKLAESTGMVDKRERPDGEAD
jgi:DNA-binding transcriptional ArsR family regulator